MTGEPQGVGVRYLDGGRRGYAYTGDLSPDALDRVVAQAAENASASDVDEFVGLPERRRRLPRDRGAVAPGTGGGEHGAEDRACAGGGARGPSVPEIETVEESTYSDAAGRAAIVSSRGVEAYGEQTFCYVYASAHARRGEDVQTALGFEAGREPAELDAEAAGTRGGGARGRPPGGEPVSQRTHHDRLRPGGGRRGAQRHRPGALRGRGAEGTVPLRRPPGPDDRRLRLQPGGRRPSSGGAWPRRPSTTRAYPGSARP